MVLRDHVTNQNYYRSNITVPMATKFGRGLTYLKRPLTISHLALWSSGPARSRDKQKPLFSTIRVPMAMKRGRIVTKLMSSYLQNHMALLSRCLTRSPDSFYSQQTWQGGDIMLNDVRGSHCYSYLTLWSRVLACSHDKLKILYLYYHKLYDHKIWQGGDIPWRAPTQKVTRFFNHVLLWNHVTY